MSGECCFDVGGAERRTGLVSFGERFAVSREAQRYNAVRLHRLDATRREAEAEKQEASDQRLMRLHAVRQHFQKTRKETDIASSPKMRALRTDLANAISVPTSDDVARELARLRAFDSMRDERLVIVGGRSVSMPVSSPGRDWETFSERSATPPADVAERRPARTVCDAETGLPITLNTLVHDVETAPLRGGFARPEQRDAVTQSYRKLGDRVNWRAGYDKEVEEAATHDAHSVPALECRLAEGGLTDMERRTIQAEILDKIKHKHHMYLAVQLEEEKQREMARELATLSERNGTAKRRLALKQDVERKQFQTQFIRMREDCEMILVAKMAEFRLLR